MFPVRVAVCGACPGICRVRPGSALPEGGVDVLTGLSVLLAEDNATNQIVAVQMLEALGARVSVASDGEEALRTLESARFDVLLIDIEMPRVSGIEVIRRLRRPDSPHAGTPTIALTAYVMHEHRRMIAAAGADGIIPKPIMSVEKFGEDIAGFVSERRARVAAPVPAATGVPVPGVATIGAVDPEALEQLERTLGTAVLRDIVERAIADIGANGDRLRAALDAGDAEQCARAAHVLIGLSGVIGADALEALARRIEAAGGTPQVAHEVATELDAAVEATLAHLKAL